MCPGSQLEPKVSSAVLIRTATGAFSVSGAASVGTSTSSSYTTLGTCRYPPAPPLRRGVKAVGFLLYPFGIPPLNLPHGPQKLTFRGGVLYFCVLRWSLKLFENVKLSSKIVFSLPRLPETAQDKPQTSSRQPRRSQDFLQTRSGPQAKPKMGPDRTRLA